MVNLISAYYSSGCEISTSFEVLPYRQTKTTQDKNSRKRHIPFLIVPTIPKQLFFKTSYLPLLLPTLSLLLPPLVMGAPDYL